MCCRRLLISLSRAETSEVRLASLLACLSMISYDTTKIWTISLPLIQSYLILIKFFHWATLVSVENNLSAFALMNSGRFKGVFESGSPSLSRCWSECGLLTPAPSGSSLSHGSSSSNSAWLPALFPDPPTPSGDLWPLSVACPLWHWRSAGLFSPERHIMSLYSKHSYRSVPDIHAEHFQIPVIGFFKLFINAHVLGRYLCHYCTFYKITLSLRLWLKVTLQIHIIKYMTINNDVLL